MKKTILLFLTLVVGLATFVASCNNDDNGGNTTADNAIGTWKLIEAYEGTQSVSLSSCQLMETYIIGEDGQFSHELFGNQAGRTGSNSIKKNGSSNVVNGDDDGDDDGDDEGGDDEDDDSSDDGGDDHSDDGGDDGSDDDGGGGTGGGTCVSESLVIGYWNHVNGSTYEFTQNNVPVIRNITFLENNTKFSYEVVTVVGGVSTTTKYVFQRQ